MGNRLYVANLSYQTTEAELEEIFQSCGAVSSAQIVKDRDTDRSRGFGFVTMDTDESAQNAIATVNGKMLDGRPLRVSEAKPREDRPPGGGGGGGGERRYSGGGGGGGRDRNDRDRGNKRY
ncbi:MAG: RNA recognition motif domain-containing protein [Chthoniobacterales bacterium]